MGEVKGQRKKKVCSARAAAVYVGPDDVQEESSKSGSYNGIIITIA